MATIAELWALATTHDQVGNLAAAAEVYHRILMDQPDFAEAHFKLGNVFDRLGRLEDAVACYRRAVHLRPDYVDAYNNMGTVNGRLQRMDDAIACFQEAVRLRPDFVQAYNNLGTAFKSQRRLDEACVAFQEALRLRPDFAAAHHSLGSLFSQIRRFDEAAVSFQRALELDPNDAGARYLLAAVSGKELPTTAPRQYVTRLFDGYAGDFDRHLLMDLGYQGPKLLRAAIKDAPGTKALDILDLGCGTGLSGLAFQDLARSLAGVDFSPLMLSRARARGIYQNLHEGDALEALRSAGNAYDLVLAGDFFIYVGAMNEVLPAVRFALRPGGRFVFDVEAYYEDGYTLRDSARFAHSLGYIRAQAHAAGLVEQSWNKGVLRAHHGTYIDSYVIVLQKP
jgi:predicted TPR repeat methyltransferase